MCDVSQRIGTYAPSTATGDWEQKNIDLVSLTTVSTTTDNFTIEGEGFGDELSIFADKTQNETSVPGTTTFAGGIRLDGITSTTSLTATTLSTSYIVPTTTLAVTSGATTTGILSGLNLVVTNSTSTTLPSFIMSTTSASPSWIFGVAASTGTSAQITFNSGATTLTLRPYLQSAITLGSSSIRLEHTFQVAGIVVPPKTALAPLTLSSGTLTYSLYFGGTTGAKRVVMHGINITKASGSSCPLVLVGSGGTYYETYTLSYRGRTSGNNGSATTQWDITGIPIWNSTAATPMTVNTDFYMEFQYLGLISGLYEFWAVTGKSAQSDTTGSMYMNWFSGTIYMNATGLSTFNGLRLKFPSGGPLTGTVNVLAF